MNSMIEMLEGRQMFSVSVTTAMGTTALPAVQNVVMVQKGAGKLTVTEIHVTQKIDVSSAK
jgi:hypothetical protein